MEHLPVKGLAEIVLNVDDLPRMKEFYQRSFGFRLVSESCLEKEDRSIEWTGDPTISFLEIQALASPLNHAGQHPVLLALIDYRRHQHASRFAQVSDRQSALNHLAFEIPESEFEKSRSWLEDEDLSPVETRFPDMRAKALFFEDPEGNRLELICHDSNSDG